MIEHRIKATCVRGCLHYNAARTAQRRVLQTAYRSLFRDEKVDTPDLVLTALNAGIRLGVYFNHHFVLSEPCDA